MKKKKKGSSLALAGKNTAAPIISSVSFLSSFNLKRGELKWGRELAQWGDKEYSTIGDSTTRVEGTRNRGRGNFLGMSYVHGN